MKALQRDLVWVEKQFFLQECRRLAAEKNKVEKLHTQLMHELNGLNGLEKKIHSVISRRALMKVKQELRKEINRIKNVSASLRLHEGHLKHHFALEKTLILKKEKEKLSLINRGIIVI